MSANRSIRCEKASKTFCPPTASVTSRVSGMLASRSTMYRPSSSGASAPRTKRASKWSTQAP